MFTEIKYVYYENRINKLYGDDLGFFLRISIVIMISMVTEQFRFREKTDHLRSSQPLLKHKEQLSTKQHRRAVTFPIVKLEVYM